jgi:hypothetical protein
MFLLLIALVLACLSLTAESQSPAIPDHSPDPAVAPAANIPDLTYVRPSQKTKINNCLFDAYGLCPIVGAVLAAGINQLSDSPPEWNQGVKGYSRRVGYDYGIAADGTTTRYGLAESFHEDTLYYRCECRGAFPRICHAVISTLTARRGEEGHHVISILALIAPYTGSMIAVYGWYPNRYCAKDELRVGNYSLLAYVGENISLEFLYSGPPSLLRRMQLNNAHGSPIEGPNK